METIHQRMMRLRCAQGLTVKQVAQCAQVPVSTYREWEYGRQIKGEPYIKIAAALNVSVYTLLTGEESPLNEALDKIEEIQKLCRILQKNLESLK